MNQSRRKELYKELSKLGELMEDEYSPYFNDYKKEYAAIKKKLGIKNFTL